MGKHHSTRFITEESQVPAGYVPLASFDSTSRLHRALCKAHSEGKVRAVKLVRHEGDIKTGPVWLHAGDAEKFCDEYDAPRSTRAVDDSSLHTQSDAHDAAAALGEINDSLLAVCRLLERLTQAVECAATQPTVTNAHDRLVATVESNGFHN